LALSDNGAQAILEKVGVNSTGLPYNSLLPPFVRAEKTQNPLVSAGAIATATPVKGDDNKERGSRILKFFSEFAGTPLKLDEEEYTEEVKSSDMTYALAYELYSDNLLYLSPKETIPLYLSATSISVNTENLAVMGATLANWGVNPITKKRVLKEEYIQNILSVMTTNGMYDDSGEWLFTVGLPAKSGVCGGIIGIVPGKFAIAVYSPPLDKFGNSVRGAKTMKYLSDLWHLNVFHPKQGKL